MPLYENYLCKQGSGRGLFEFKTWKVRWCVVDHGCIKFYNSESQVSELRNYSLKGASLSSNIDAAAYGAPYECVFIIHFSPESQTTGSPPDVVLCVECLEDMQGWIAAINAADNCTQISKINIDEPWTWLSKEEIQNLSTMLSVDNFSPIFAFARIITPSQSGPFYDHSSLLLLHSGQLPRFVDICIEQVMAGQVLSTLFRENGVDLRFIARYMFLVGKDYLKNVVEPHITSILHHSSLEVNPLKVQIVDSGASLSAEEKSAIQESHCRNNHVKIMSITSSLLKSIDSAELPDPIVKVLHRIATLVSREFPEFLYAGVCNVFFLRFIVASLCTPHTFGLCTDFPELSAAQARSLNIIAKVVQNVANGIVENKKEPFMQPLAAFVTEQQIFMVKFLSKVMCAGTLLNSEQVSSSLQSSASTSTMSSISKITMQDLQSSSNWWIQFIHKHSTALPPALQTSISRYEFDSSPMRDSIRGQLANWSLIMDGKLVFLQPVLLSSLKPTIFGGNAFVVARFNCWCKLNRTMLHGTLFVTRSAFIFIASGFDSFDEILVMRFTKIERITKLNVVDIESLVQLDLNRAFFLDLQSAIRIDLTMDVDSVPVILFGITVDSNIAVPIDGSIDATGKKSPSIFAAMYSLLSLSKTRQEAESADVAKELPKSASFRRVNSTDVSAPLAPLNKSSSLNLGKSLSRRTMVISVQGIPQLQVLQEFSKVNLDEASAKGLPSIQQARRGSIRTHAECLLRHIHAHRNCYETNFSGTRVATQDPPILTRVDLEAISPFMCVMVFNAGEYAEFPDSSKRFLLNVNNGSFAYCSGSKKSVEFFITRGNNFIYEIDTAAHDFAQLYACEPRSSLIMLPMPLESIPNAPEGLENRLFQFTLAVASSSFREMKRIERSLTLALQSHSSATNGEVLSGDTSKNLADAPLGELAPHELSSGKVSSSNQMHSTIERERMLQAVLQSRLTQRSSQAPTIDLDNSSDIPDEDSD